MPTRCEHLDQIRVVTPRTLQGCEECLQMMLKPAPQPGAKP